MALAKTGNKYFKIILIACVIALTVYLFYSFKKVDFINNKIKQVVAEKTDQLYKVHYDSISVNEVEGNLFIKNLYIQGDTARQKQLINNGDTNAAKIILNIHIPVLEVRHFKTAAALLSKQL